MVMLSDYVDESYNATTFCVGGWLAPVTTWSKIERSWKERLAYENRLSVKAGFKPISRYHATDCANLKKEFAEKNGWDIPRQIRLSRKLGRVIASHAPRGIVIGGRIENFNKIFPNQPDPKKDLYYLTFSMHLLFIAEEMKRHYPNDRVTVFYDRSKNLGGMAEVAFNKFMTEDATKDLAKYFVTVASMGWEDCVPLQPADMLAYEGMKRIEQSVAGKEELRKALREIVGPKTPLAIGYYSDDNLKELLRAGLKRRDELAREVSS